MLRPRPLRTVRASLDAHGSSRPRGLTLPSPVITSVVLLVTGGASEFQVLPLVGATCTPVDDVVHVERTRSDREPVHPIVNVIWLRRDARGANHPRRTGSTRPAPALPVLGRTTPASARSTAPTARPLMMSTAAFSPVPGAVAVCLLSTWRAAALHPLEGRHHCGCPRRLPDLSWGSRACWRSTTCRPADHLPAQGRAVRRRPDRHPGAVGRHPTIHRMHCLASSYKALSRVRMSSAIRHSPSDRRRLNV